MKLSWIEINIKIKAGLTSLEVKFKTAEWEEELRKLTIENVGLGKPLKHLSTDYILITIFFQLW